MVDLAGCPLSSWTGRKTRCRWCDKVLVGRQQSWCSRRCNIEFTRNHFYNAARHVTKIAARAECVCPNKAFYLRSGGRRSPKHVVCRECGRCERVVVMECNHIEPRLGDNRSLSCRHHLTNLEMLCQGCHQGVTLAQRSLWRRPAGKRRRRAV